MNTDISFDRIMIALCGINCGTCIAYLRTKNKCSGCLPASLNKPKTRYYCKIKNCEQLNRISSGFCYDCALSYRDKLVGKATKSDKAIINYQKGNNFSAAIIDFSENLFLGAIPQTLMGLGIVVPYFSVAKQGWVGGIVSVNAEHESRFKSFKSAFYYFFVLLLQFIPYSLAVGAGIRCGIDFYNYNKMHGWLLWKYRIQTTSLIDLGCVYILVVPIFFLASCFEFISKWNM